MVRIFLLLLGMCNSLVYYYKGCVKKVLRSILSPLGLCNSCKVVFYYY